MKTALGVLLLAAVLLVAALVWQESRYLAIRRGPVQDRQPLWYPAETFHVVTVLAVPEDRDVLEEVRKLRALVESSDGSRMVYAGQAAFVGLRSAQLPDAEWNTAILVQHPSREAWDALAASEAWQAAMDSFPAAHSHGMKRDRFFNVALHEAFLAMRLRDLVTFRPSRFPFVKAETLGGIRRDTVGEFAKLEKLKPLGEDAVVVVNLLKEGTAEQRASDRAYALEMFGGMAEGVYGPMHIGSAVRVEGEAEYDRVALVYYPGIDFFRSMVESTFFNEIIGDKQLGDTMAMITVPLLDSL